MTEATKVVSDLGFALDVTSNSIPHYVPEEDELVQTLLKVYRKYTGDESKPFIYWWRYVCADDEKRGSLWHAFPR